MNMNKESEVLIADDNAANILVSAEKLQAS